MTMREFYKEFSNLIKYEEDEDVKVQIMAFDSLEQGEAISIEVNTWIHEDLTTFTIKEIAIADTNNMTEKEEKAILKEVTKVSKAFKEKYELFNFEIEVYDKFICTP